MQHHVSAVLVAIVACDARAESEASRPYDGCGETPQAAADYWRGRATDARKSLRNLWADDTTPRTDRPVRFRYVERPLRMGFRSFRVQWASFPLRTVA